MTLTKECRGYDEIEAFLKSNCNGELFEEDQQRFINFMEYAKYKRLFKHSKLVDVKHKTLKTGTESLNLQVNLINSSVFSTLKPNDKQIHYLPSDEISRIVKKDTESLSLTIIHHSHEWFWATCKKELETVIANNSNLVFIGHEHEIKSYNGLFSDNDAVHVCRGGEYSGVYYKESTFSTILFNSSENTVTDSFFRWDAQESVFRNYENKTQVIKLCSNPFEYKKSFIQDFYNDGTSSSNSLLDYFTIPKITKISSDYDNEDDNEVTENELKSILLNEKFINFTSFSENGKTTLLKYTHYYFDSIGYSPLFLSSDNYKDKKIDFLLKELFEEQYCKTGDYDKFLQLERSKKVVIIDDFDRIQSHKQQEKLLKYLEQNVGKIIFSSNRQSITSVLDYIKNSVENDCDICTYEIHSFFMSKRNNLVRKYCNACLGAHLSDEDIDDVVNNINRLVKKRQDIISLSPGNLIQYVNYFANNNIEKIKSDTIFNEIFYTNIVNSLRPIIKDDDIIEYMTQLEEISYFMHFNKSPIINLSDLNKIIEQYNSDMDLDTNTNSFVYALCKAKILTKGNSRNTYRFANKNCFAYFVARKIARKIDRNEEYMTDIKFISNHITLNINDIILMFLLNLRNNTKFIMYLCDETNNILTDYQELNFDPCNISFFKKDFNADIAFPGDAHKSKRLIEEDANEKRKELEKEDRNENELVFVNGYEYDEDIIDEEYNKLERSYKYIEIISKSFVSQFSILNKAEKSSIAQTILVCSNKILYAILSPLDNEFEETLSLLVKIKVDMQGKQADIEETRRELVDLIIKVARIVTLETYDSIAFYCTTSKTIKSLEKLFNKSVSNHIQQLIMIYYTNDRDAYIDETIKLLDKHKNNKIVCTLAMMFMQEFLTQVKSLTHSQIDKIDKKIFKGSKKKLIGTIKIK